MSLEKIIAENILRFGVKNLSEKSKKILNEQARVEAIEFNLDEMPAALQRINYTPSPLKYIAIPDGNPWLATNRAVSLKNFLIANVQKQVGIEFDANAVKIAETAVSTEKGDEYQYVEGSIYGWMSKPPEIQSEYPYNIQYNWYNIGGVPYILNTKIGKGTPIQQASPSQIKQLQSQMPTDVDSIIVKQSTGGGTEDGPSMYTTGMLIPIKKDKFNWSALKNGIMYFTDANAYNAAKTFIMDYTADQAGVGAELDIKRNSTSTNFTKNAGGGGNDIFGKLDNGAKANILAGTGAGSDINITRMWTGKEGDVPGDVIKGKEGKWVPLGAFQLSKKDGAFLDNMITLQPGAYKKVFDSIKAEVDKQKADGLDIKSLTAIIKGYASADRATNRLPKGVTAPDHTYGGHVPARYWIAQ